MIRRPGKTISIIRPLGSTLRILIMASLSLSLLSACKLTDNSVKGELGSIAGPSVTFDSLAPSATIGNSSTMFSFHLTYANVESVNLQNSHLIVSYTGSVSCNSPTINNPQTTTPYFNITNCTGDGTLKVILNPGTSLAEGGGTDQGAVSIDVTVDNTAPTAAVGSPSPASGDNTADFDFPVTFSGANTINLAAGDITVNDGGGGTCDTPVVSNGSTASPTVTLSNCVGNGTVGITVNANAASDLGGNQNVASAASATVTVSNAIACPSGFIPIPGNATYGTSDFCVMKYEAKAEKDSDSSLRAWGCWENTWACSTGDWVLANSPAEDATPVSVPTARPWRMISRAQALAECQSLGINYDLISNDEWQTIARDVVQQASNWSGVGGVGDGLINHGHADTVPYEPLEANSSDALGCHLTGQTCNGGAGGDWNYEKRTHTLSNSEVIWDLAGNVYEWTKDDYLDGIGYDVDALISQITAGTHINVRSLSGGTTTTGRNAKDQFGPAGDFTGLNSGEYGGLGIGYLNYFASSVIRGGDWNPPVAGATGIFTVYLNENPLNGGNVSIGFRCVYRP